MDTEIQTGTDKILPFKSVAEFPSSGMEASTQSHEMTLGSVRLSYDLPEAATFVVPDIKRARAVTHFPNLEVSIETGKLETGELLQDLSVRTLRALAEKNISRVIAEEIDGKSS